MSAFQATVIILLFSICQLDVVIGDLNGSCIGAGITECCHDGCIATPDFCYCDPSCEMFGDCCSDIYELCNPEIEHAHNNYRPVVMHPENTSLHVVYLRWTIIPRASVINGTYEIFLYQAADDSDLVPPSNDTPTVQNHSVSVDASNTKADSMFQRSFLLQLAGLEADTTYVYRMAIKSDVRTIDDVYHGSFRTASYPSIDNIKLVMTETNAVRVSWTTPSLPIGVSLVQFKVQYEEEGEERAVGEANTMETTVDFHGLKLHQKYIFRVIAVVTDTDGSEYQFSATEDGLELYIPDMSIFQLVAVSSIPCENWSLPDEEQVTSNLRSELLNLLVNSCVEFPGENFLDETLTPLCDNVHNETSIRITFRARIVSVEGCSSFHLLDAIEDWKTSSEVQPRVAGYSFDVSTACPTTVEYHNSPFCTSQLSKPEPEVGTLVVESVAEKCPVSTVMLVAYMLAEFGLLTVLYLSIFLGVYYWKFSKKRSGARMPHPKCFENSYSNSSSIKLEEDSDREEQGNVKCVI